MLEGLGDADREFTHAILGPTPEERQVDKVRNDNLSLRK